MLNSIYSQLFRFPLTQDSDIRLFQISLNLVLLESGHPLTTYEHNKVYQKTYKQIIRACFYYTSSKEKRGAKRKNWFIRKSEQNNSDKTNDVTNNYAINSDKSSTNHYDTKGTRKKQTLLNSVVSEWLIFQGEPIHDQAVRQFSYYTEE